MGNVTFISRKELFRICQTSFFFLQAFLLLKAIFLQKIQSRRLLLEHKENTFLLCHLVDHTLFLFFPLPPSPSGFHNCMFSCYPLSCRQHIVAIASSLPRSPHMLVSLKTRFSLMLFSLQALSLYVPYMPMVTITIYIRVSQNVVPGTAYIGIMGRGELKIQVPWFYQRPIQSTLWVGTGNLHFQYILRFCPTKVGTTARVKEGLVEANNGSSTSPSGGFLILLSQFGKCSPCLLGNSELSEKQEKQRNKGH